MPKDRGTDAGVEAAVEGSGVLMARANGADAAAGAVLAAVPGKWKPPEAAGAADDAAGVSPKDKPVLGAPAC